MTASTAAILGGATTKKMEQVEIEAASNHENAHHFGDDCVGLNFDRLAHDSDWRFGRRPLLCVTRGAKLWGGAKKTKEEKGI